MDDHMFAIGFIPNRMNINPQVTDFQEGLELSSTLMREPVTDAKGVFFYFHNKQRGWPQEEQEIRSYHLTISGGIVKAGFGIQNSEFRI
jgi:hypothetical protein